MSQASSRACRDCSRRSWLLSELTVPLDCRAGVGTRLLDLLGLGDEELIAALGGRRAEELRARCAEFDAGELVPKPGVETICRHRRAFPRRLRTRHGPSLLNVAGTASRLTRLAAAPTVAIVGTTRPSDQGVASARALARGMSASGVTVVASLAGGIAAAAQEGTLEAAGNAIVVVDGGLGGPCAARMRPLLADVPRRGCAVSELPHDLPGRRWGTLAAVRTVVALAQLTVVVEARDDPGELLCAAVAAAVGRPIAAVPGRVSSPLSRGPHALLKSGASLVEGAGDVLALLHRAGAGARPGVALESRLRDTLERVASGADTPERLGRDGADPDEILLALTELELMGLLGRSAGGRYLPLEP